MKFNDFFDSAIRLKWWDELYTSTAVDTGNGVVQNPAEFTESGDFTAPDGVTEVVIGICGGGGGSDNKACGGGGSGMTYHKVYLNDNETVEVTIGAGGSSDNAGGSSIFDADSDTITADGGGGNSNDDKGGIGVNGGGNGGCCGDSSGVAGAGGSVLATKVIAGNIVTKKIECGMHVVNRGSGGAGGGYEYPGVGGSYGYDATGYGAGGLKGEGTDGICVIWY